MLAPKGETQVLLVSQRDHDALVRSHPRLRVTRADRTYTPGFGAFDLGLWDLERSARRGRHAPQGM